MKTVLLEQDCVLWTMLNCMLYSLNTKTMVTWLWTFKGAMAIIWMILRNALQVLASFDGGECNRRASYDLKSAVSCLDNSMRRTTLAQGWGSIGMVDTLMDSVRQFERRPALASLACESLSYILSSHCGIRSSFKQTYGTGRASVIVEEAISCGVCHHARLQAEAKKLEKFLS